MRLKHDPEIHELHKKPYTMHEKYYIAYSIKDMTEREISIQLGRTEGAISAQLALMRTQGKFEQYRKLYRG